MATGFTVGAPTCSDPEPSSALMVLEASTAASSGFWSLTTLGWWYAAFVGLVAGFGAWAASAAGLLRTAVIAVPVAPLVLPAFSRFFVSTYSEPAGLLGAVATACGVAALLATRTEHRSARAVALALTAGGGLAAGTAKVAYLPVLAAAILTCAVVALGVGRCRRVAGPAVALATVVLAIYPVVTAVHRQDATYESVNTHDLVFTLALYELGPGAIGALGLPPQAAAVTGNGYFNGPPRPEDAWWRRAILDQPNVTRRTTYEALASHPETVARAVGVGLAATMRADLPYLASTPAVAGVRSQPTGDPGWSGAQQQNLRNVLTMTRRPAWVPTVLVLLAVAAAAVAPVLRRRAPAAAQWCVGAGLGAVTALGLVVVAVMGDGYFEVFKHVWLAAYLLLLAALCLAGAVVSTGAAVGPPAFRRRAPARPTGS